MNVTSKADDIITWGLIKLDLIWKLGLLYSTWNLMLLYHSAFVNIVYGITLPSSHKTVALIKRGLVYARCVWRGGRRLHTRSSGTVQSVISFWRFRAFTCLNLVWVAPCNRWTAFEKLRRGFDFFKHEIKKKGSDLCEVHTDTTITTTMCIHTEWGTHTSLGSFFSALRLPRGSSFYWKSAQGPGRGFSRL